MTPGDHIVFCSDGIFEAENADRLHLDISYPISSLGAGEIIPDEKESMYIHRIDSAHRIVFVNQAWVDFASANDADHLRADKVLGTSLWDYISDLETIFLYKTILGRATEEGRTLRFPFRCDSPDVIRHMEMRVSRLPDASYEFVSLSLREETRTSLQLLCPSIQRSDELIRMCSWCKKIDLSDNRWVEVEEAVRLLGLFTVQPLPQITHGACPECYAQVLAEIER